MATKTFSFTEDERYIILDALVEFGYHYKKVELTKIQALIYRIDPYYDESDDDHDV